MTINLNRLKTYPIKARKNKTKRQDFAKPPERGIDFDGFLASLPKIFIGKEFREFVERIALAHKAHKPIIAMLGAHVIKCGLSPVIIDLMERRLITAVALNGAGMIHDFELALIGETSEDVAETIEDGSFGMAAETGEYLNLAIKEGRKKGMGAAVGEMIRRKMLKFKSQSILYNGVKEGVPVTVHVAIGTDIIHQHPNCDGASTGEASLIDFHRFIESVSKLGDGGVIMNFGSAVLLPEVFLKALTVARNLGFKVRDFTAANFDKIAQYRPHQNVITRPVSLGGKGFDFTGHHEIMLPLLAQAVIERL